MLNTKTLKIIILLVLIGVPFTSSAQLKVVVSIKPIQLIIASLTEGEVLPKLLIPIGSSPHHYKFKPSDIKRINQADLIVWGGQALTPALAKPLSLRTKKKIITLLEHEKLKPLLYQSNHNHDDRHRHAPNTDHQYNIDPHFWLGAEETIMSAYAIIEVLKKLQPEQAIKMDNQLKQFTINVRKQKQRLIKIVHNLISDRKYQYVVFHDAYSYFERQLGLAHVAAFTINNQLPLSSKKIVNISLLLGSSNNCLFVDLQSSIKTAQQIAKSTNSKLIKLDHFGANITVDKAGYFKFIKQFATSFLKDCFATKIDNDSKKIK